MDLIVDISTFKSITPCHKLLCIATMKVECDLIAGLAVFIELLLKLALRRINERHWSIKWFPYSGESMKLKSKYIRLEF